MLEVLIVIGLVAIIMAMGLAMSMDAFRGFSFRNDRDAVVAALQRARSQAVNNICLGSACNDGKRHGVRFTAHEIIIFQDGTDPQDEIIKFESNATKVISSSTVVFEQLSGDNVSGVTDTIRIEDGAGRWAEIKVNPIGQIDF